MSTGRRRSRHLFFSTRGCLNTALIGNRADEFVALTGDAAGRTVASARTTGSDLRLSIDYATAEAGAYPLVLVYL